VGGLTDGGVREASKAAEAAEQRIGCPAQAVLSGLTAAAPHLSLKTRVLCSVGFLLTVSISSIVLAGLRERFLQAVLTRSTPLWFRRRLLCCCLTLVAIKIQLD
jgi:hypothetical protein